MDQKTELIRFWKENFKFKDAEIRAFSEVNREDFIPESLRMQAYHDTPLPLIRGKTISQPTTVMLMTSLLEIKPGEKVFELGTGSGYQAAIIARIVGKGKVITTEVVPELVMFARENLARSNIPNAVIYEEDGSKGMPSEAPFDKIIITSACKEFPPPLLEQLKTGGIIVGPVGNREQQEMVRGIKGKDGHLSLDFYGPFLFTPMYGKYGFED
ncbi:MAG TPA: protein-L-isoaspartate(D-aspartate) O-methyltransferase [Candidatus Nanoarchaeia archaeon]|nr:protein-L-isoaspartate(D-aspartate) O-methyltransferase [Candidatus Nanoarchaeia archaeon]